MSTVSSTRGFNAADDRPRSPGLRRKIRQVIENCLWLPLIPLRYYFSAPKAPGILGLPNEVLLEIMGYLELHDVYLLSKTCKRFQALAPKNWDLVLGQLNDIQHLHLVTGIVYGEKNGRVCPCRACQDFHKVNKCIMPFSKWYERH
ncbi:hypothetical protein Cob_v002349 [Colletotrichum orbiculare MAFF 240422]|uniref:F-box domain-containing protein n=1 Tax=Colletotrichum orbiculare (strain 104-T / ATCC 96160 / CBS 514.97 / LARS 414 / MAFF 240422) TaxID=1213857 RepID=A0A484G312_COLOR|nr:hypothetical protein Cob_v002349 [Colletotrichum orbiculare MAFF 240422]